MGSTQIDFQASPPHPLSLRALQDQSYKIRRRGSWPCLTFSGAAEFEAIDDGFEAIDDSPPPVSPSRAKPRSKKKDKSKKDKGPKKQKSGRGARKGD